MRATKVDFNPGNCPERFGPALEDFLRRLVQESLTNAISDGGRGFSILAAMPFHLKENDDVR
jgi:hypothetical protein